MTSELATFRPPPLKAFDSKTVSQCAVAQIVQVKQREENVNILPVAIVQTVPQAGEKPSGNELAEDAELPIYQKLCAGPQSRRVREKRP